VAAGRVAPGRGPCEPDEPDEPGAPACDAPGRTPGLEDWDVGPAWPERTMGALAGRLGSLRTPGGVASVRVGVVELITDVGVGVGLADGVAVGVARTGASASGLRGGVAASMRVDSEAGLRSGESARSGAGVVTGAAVAGLRVGSARCSSDAPAALIEDEEDDEADEADEDDKADEPACAATPMPFALARIGSSWRDGDVALGRSVGATLATGLEGPVARGGRRTAGGVAFGALVGGPE